MLGLMGFISASMSNLFSILSFLTSPNLMKYMLMKFKHMVECSRCLKWYHQMCERIPDSVLNDSDKIRYCQLCLQEEEKNQKMEGRD